MRVLWWPDGGDTAVISAPNLHRRFLDDGELVAIDAILRDARRLVTGAAVPRSIRDDLAPICCELAQVLHCGPHLKARR